MDFNEVLYTRRSVRKYESRPVEREKLDEVLKAASYAPSALNNRDRKFVAITNASVLARLNEVVANAVDETTRERITSRGNGKFEFFYSAPVLILVATSNELCARADCAVALENAFLAAKNLGLGSCWINQLNGLNDDPAVRELFGELGLEANDRVYGCCALGYPACETPLSKPKGDKTIIIV